MKRKITHFSRFGSWLRRQNPVIFTLVLIGVAFILGTLVTAPFQLGWVADVQFFETPLDRSLPLFAIFFMAVIVAPLFETALFQALPFWILWRFATFRRHRWLMVVIMAMIFGAQHYYAVSYIIATVVIGAVLMYAYIVKWRKNAYWNVVLLHAVWNAMAFAIDQLSKQGVF